MGWLKLLNYTEKDPLIDPACFIEVFRCCAAAVNSDGDSGVDEDHPSPPNEEQVALYGDSLLHEANSDDPGL